MNYDYLLPDQTTTIIQPLNPEQRPVNLKNEKSTQSSYYYLPSIKSNKQNEDLLKRNFNNSNFEVRLDMRPEMTSLSRHKNLPNQPLPDSTEKMLKTTNFSCNPQLSSGSSDPSRYFLNIDVESRLKNIDHIKRKCKTHIYSTNPDCKDCRLSCFRNILNKDHNVNINNEFRPIEKCSNKTFWNVANPKDFEDVNVYLRPQQDTSYDLTKHPICNLKTEKVWHNNTKRSMFNNKCCN